MRKFKFIKWIILVFFLINAVDLLLDKVNHISDISKENKITIYDMNDEIIYERNNIHDSSYVNIEDVNDITKRVFVEVEDKRFYLHNGIDIITTTKAFMSNINSDSLIGGSTITQQYVKNLYLSNEKTYIRKIKECYYALRVEKLYTKDQILEGYLNTIYFNNGIYGINDAAKYYFNKTPKNLTLREAVSLVSIIKSPSNYCLVNNYSNNNSRTLKLLNNLYSRNIISEKDYNKAIYETPVITKTDITRYSSSVLYFKDYVLNNIIINNKETRIYTQFNSGLNLLIDNLVKNIDCDISIVVMDKNGYITSIIGNKNYYNSTYNIASSSTRMIGSTIKPMLYYEALMYGINPDDTFLSEKQEFHINNEIISIKNFNDTYDNKQINMRYALATSDNIYAFKTHFFIGTDKLSSFLLKFDIEPIDDEYTICLGTQDMSLLNLTSIYNTFLNNGYFCEPKSFEHIIEDSNESTNINLKVPLLNENICKEINLLMKGTFDVSLNGANSVTGASIAPLLNKEVSGKSGLTDFDSYMVGSTDDFTVAIWAGHGDNTLLTDIKNKKLPKELFYKIVNFL